MSETQNRAQLELLESRYYGRLAEVDRLNAERLLQDAITFSDELLILRDDPVIEKILTEQQNLFEVRRCQYHGQLEILRHSISQVEEQVRPLDVDNVYPGQTARLCFSAFIWRTTPQVEGKVERVSADVFSDQEAGTAYYIARMRGRVTEKRGTFIL